MFLKNRLLRKAASILTSLAIFSSTIPLIAAAEEIPTSGMCGDYTTWAFNADTKTLTIGVSGESENGAYNVYYDEWRNYETQIENVVIEEGVTSITGLGNNDYIKSASIPSTICSYSFADCDALETVTLANGITAIPNEAFRSCDSLKEITVPDSVTTIGISAFNSCNALSKVILSSNLETINDLAFLNCTALMELEIPESVSYICDEVFINMPDGFKIKGKYNSYAENYAIAHYIAFEGVGTLEATTDLKYNLLADGTYEATNYTGTALHIVIPSTFNGKPVTAISDRAFDGNRNIVEVVVPESVTKIGNYAFTGCSNLKSVKLHDGITEIGEGAFYRCSLSDGFTIPAGVKTLKREVFERSGLKEIVIPATVEIIDYYAFESCENLTDVTISEGVRVISDYAFGFCDNLKSIHIPSTAIIGWSYEAYTDGNGNYWTPWGGIPSTTVSDMGVINSCTPIPSNGLPIGTYTRMLLACYTGNFIQGSGVETITIAPENPYMKVIDNVLYDKSGTRLIAYPCGNTNKSFTIPDGVKYIGEYAFAHCDLEYINLPDSITDIEIDAFWDCNDLKEITIPKNVTGISSGDFESCESLENVYIDDNNPYYYDVDGVVFSKAYEKLYHEKSSSGYEDVYTTGRKYESDFFENDAFIIHKETVVITSQAEKVEDNKENTNETPDDSFEEDAEIEGGEEFDKLICENPVELIYYPEGRTAETYTVPTGVDYIKTRFNNVKELIIPDGVYALSSSVLGNHYFLETVTIPASVKFIDSYSVDEYYSLLTIKGYTNSYAEVFAKAHNINFISIGEVDPEETYYYIRTTVEGGDCTVTPSKAEAVVEGRNLTLSFTPDNSPTAATQYEIESVTIDGVDMGYIKSYTFENVSADHNVVVKLKTVSNRIPTVSKPSGSYGPVNTTPVTDEDEKNAILVKDTEGAIKADGTDKVWEEIADEISEKKDGESVAIKLPAAATEVPANLLESVKGKDVQIEIKLENGVTWNINGLSVRDPKAINLGVTINSNKIPRDALTNVPNGVHNIEVSLEHDGDLGFDATLTFDFDERYNNFYSNLYFFNPDLGDFEFMGAATIHNGKAGHGFSHASDYIIIVDEENLGKKAVEIEEEDITEDDEENEIDEKTEESTTDDKENRIDDETEENVNEAEKEDAVVEEDDDENPATGTAISLTALISAAAAVLLAKKKK